MGLATVYGITKQHHGWTQVRSALGNGSAFRIFLPLASKVASSETIQRVVQAKRGGECILIVEDDAMVRKVAARALHMGGYRVLEAIDGG